jgi:hypothetical protein
MDQSNEARSKVRHDMLDCLLALELIIALWLVATGGG